MATYSFLKPQNSFNQKHPYNKTDTFQEADEKEASLTMYTGGSSYDSEKQETSRS